MAYEYPDRSNDQTAAFPPPYNAGAAGSVSRRDASGRLSLGGRKRVSRYGDASGAFRLFLYQCRRASRDPERGARRTAGRDQKGAKRLAEIGAWEEQLEFARQAVAEFPSEEELQLNLAQVLQGAVREEQLDKSYLDEAEKILRTLLDTTSDDERRCKVMESLVEYYAIELKDS